MLFRHSPHADKQAPFCPPGSNANRSDHAQRPASHGEVAGKHLCATVSRQKVIVTGQRCSRFYLSMYKTRRPGDKTSAALFTPEGGYGTRLAQSPCVTVRGGMANVIERVLGIGAATREDARSPGP